MQIHTVLWDHKPHWLSQPGYLEVSLVWQLQKLGYQKSEQLLSERYWWAGARQREYPKLMSTSLCSVRVPLYASRFVLKLKDKYRSLSQKEWGCVSVCCLWSDLWGGSLTKTLPDWYSCMGPRNTSPPSLQSQAIREIDPLGWHLQKSRHWTCTKAPFWEILALKSIAKGEYKNSACYLRSLERITYLSVF